MKIYLDMDGVLADFDAASRSALGTDNPYKWEFVHGTDAFWRVLNNTPNFWEDIPPTKDLPTLLQAVAGHDVEILTALPKRDADRVVKAKTDWVNTNVRPVIGAVKVNTCLTHEKPEYSGKGHVLIDDRELNKDKWELKQGIFILFDDILRVKKALRNAETLSDRLVEEQKSPRDRKYLKNAVKQYVGGV